MDGSQLFIEVSKALSIAAIPVGLAVGGWVLQRTIQKQSLRKEYVALAISILREPDNDKVGNELRAWAVDLLNLNSDVKFDDETTKLLKNGSWQLPSEIVGAGLTSRRERELGAFLRFLKQAGFKLSSTRIRYEVVPGDRIDVDGIEFSSLYDPNTNTIRIASKYADDPDVAFHELMRRALDRPNTTPTLSLSALNSGLSVYYVCSFSGSSIHASTTDLAIDLERDLPLNTPKLRSEVDSYDVGSNNWAATFWALRKRLGGPTADRLLAKVWFEWQPPTQESKVFVAFGRALAEADASSDDAVREVLTARGLRLGEA